MKRFLLILLISIAAFATSCTVCNTTSGSGRRIKGSGKLIASEMPVPAFDAIDASRAVHVVITDKVDKIHIEADDNVMDLVEVKASKGTLRIGISSKCQSLSDIHVTVKVPDNGRIASLSASSAAKIRTEVGLTADQFEIDASSAAHIEVAVKARKCLVDATSAARVHAAISADECSADLSSAAKVRLSGRADRLTADLSSASKLDAEKLRTRKCSLDTSSAAHAEVNCSEMLVADASSGSSIRYSGDCKTSIDKSSGASVRKN
ncbi:MAG: DUF2807 domain-containing protein [Alistipes sp.]|nr:DUF2807 domain-containing protein [Alistipes sp.]